MAECAILAEASNRHSALAGQGSIVDAEQPPPAFTLQTSTVRSLAYNDLFFIGANSTGRNDREQCTVISMFPVRGEESDERSG
ncbi:MAG: hypothetical protein QOH31_3061 [Verrucomicrobiota bacterium]|jgi:hypothetical protein